jgi:VCBS repeat protein
MLNYSPCPRGSWLVPLASLVLLASPLEAQDRLLDRQRRMLPWNGPRPGAVSGNFDADAFPDVLSLASGSAGQGFGLFRATPDGALEPTATFVAQPWSPYENTLVADDFDLDGKLDVLWLGEAECSPYAPGCASGFANLWRGDGAGGFTPVAGAVPGAESLRLRAAASGDLTGDGLPEIVAATFRHAWAPYFGGPTSYEGGGCVRWSSLGGGIFSAPSLAFPDGLEGDATLVRLADVDVDGDLDLYRQQGSGDSISRNLGNGAMGAPAYFWNGTFTATRDALFVDADQDGDPDLVTTSGMSGPDEVRLHRNGGTGTFALDANALPPVSLASSLALADANHDGRDDLLLVGTLDIGLCLASGSEFVAGDAVPDSSAPARLLVADFDQDADDDLLVLRLDGDSLHLSGSQGWTKVSSPDTGRRLASAATAGLDADGDGDRDVIVSCPNGSNAVLANDGAGRFGAASGGEWTSAYTATFENHNGHALASADLDGDGDVDLVTARQYPSQPGLSYRNQGGAFTSQGDFPGALGAIAVSLADVDGNGHPDALFALESYGLSGMQLHMNAAGSFALASGAVPATSPALVQQMADLDDDGDPDLLQGLNGSHEHPALQVRKNHWPAPFTLWRLRIPPTTAFASALAVSDVDRDGDLDVLLGTGSPSGPSSPQLLLNTPGALVAAPTPALSAWTTDLEPADFDEDGDDDVLLVNRGASHRLWANDGAGGFSDESTLLPQDAWMYGTPRAEVADFDGDADLDVLLAGTGTIDVWFGLRRQLAWSHVPAIGKPLDFELHGAPGSPWVLGASVGRASIPVPGLGTLLLDPSTAVVLGQGVQDAIGEAHHTLALPASASLVGREFFAQAALGAPLVLGNLERVRITDL